MLHISFRMLGTEDKALMQRLFANTVGVDKKCAISGTLVDKKSFDLGRFHVTFSLN